MARYTEEQFRITIIKYLDEHWEEIMDTTPYLELFGYTDRHFNRKFKESFGIPFYQYLTKYKLHRAAEEIRESANLTNVGKRAGFSNPQSFSKAFRNEFGLSPRAFLKSDKVVEDMPVHCLIDGVPVEVEYKTIDGFTLHGTYVTLNQTENLNMVEERGYLYIHPASNVETGLSLKDRFGMLIRLTP